jgi:hypothetical protein
LINVDWITAGYFSQGRQGAKKAVRGQVCVLSVLREIRLKALAVADKDKHGSPLRPVQCLNLF